MEFAVQKQPARECFMARWSTSAPSSAPHREFRCSFNNGGMVFNGQRCDVRADRWRPLRRWRFQGPVVNDATIIAAGSAGGDYGVAIQAAGNVGNLGTASLIEGYGGVQIDGRYRDQRRHDRIRSRARFHVAGKLHWTAMPD